MRALSLFSGIGGIDLAAEWAGIETVAFCEREPFCQKVLTKNWPNIPIYDDVCTLTKERLEADGIGTIELIHGGYPCQPFSTAGERKGQNDDRHLWPEVRRLIESIRPRWFVGENVAGHVSLGLDEVLSDLEDLSYTTQSFVIPACSVGALHRRDRVFIAAYTDGIGRMEHKRFQKTVQQTWDEIVQREENEESSMQQFIYSRNENATDTNSTRQSAGGREESTRGRFVGGYYNENVSHAPSIGQQRQRKLIESFDTTQDPIRKTSESLHVRIGDQWSIEPDVGRVANGIPDRIHRLKALGNAVVPQQIYPILAAIKQIDDMLQAV